MRVSRRRVLLLILPLIIVTVAVGILLFGQSTQPSSESPPPPPGLPAQLTSPNLLVVPEVPLGPIAVIATCFIAMLIARKMAKNRLPNSR